MVAIAHELEGNPELVAWCPSCRSTVVPMGKRGRCGWCDSPTFASQADVPPPQAEPESTPDLLAAIETPAPSREDRLLEQLDCVLTSLRHIETWSGNALHRLRQGEAVTGLSQLRKIQLEAADTIRWAESLTGGRAS